MWWKKRASLNLVWTLMLIGSWGCAPRLAPVVPEGLALQPGRFLTGCYRAPDFAPERAVYVLETFTVAESYGIAPDTFAQLLQDELTLAWQANGLRTAPRGEVALSGTVQYVDLRGTSLRFVTGKLYANLVVSGAIRRGQDTLFAFQDRLHLTSPLNPGPGAPKEAELLLRQAARTFAVHLLNELLLYGLPAEGK